MILAISNFKKMNEPDLLGKFPFSHIWASFSPIEMGQKWPQKWVYIIFDKICHLILLKIVENGRLLHGLIVQAPYLTKPFFLGDCPKCSIPIGLHDSSKCIISRKSSVIDLCVDFLQIVRDLWKLQIDHVLLVWFGRTYPDILKVLRNS